MSQEVQFVGSTILERLAPHRRRCLISIFSWMNVRLLFSKMTLSRASNLVIKFRNVATALSQAEI